MVVASRNRGKLAELRELLAGVDGEIVGAEDLDLPEIEEDGVSFEANAAKKARSAAIAARAPSLADDSGLEVDALGGAPGMQSARYCGRHGDDARNNRRLLDELRGVPRDRRSARFRAVVVFADPLGRLGEKVMVGEGVCEGWILEAPRGEGGFGYDPLFFSPELGMTFAEAGAGPKSGVSHRARALRSIQSELRAYLSERPR